jgi:hypothetical protein
MSNLYATHTHHSHTYYKRLILALSQSVENGFSHREIAAFLNAAKILSPTGKIFTTKTVANTLKSFRTPLEISSLAYQAMMTMLFKRELTNGQCLPLLSPASGLT